MLFGDFADRLTELPDRSLDAIITDPPYAIESEVWSELADVAARLLKHQGFLIARLNPSHLSDVMTLLSESDLDFGWLYCQLPPTPGARSNARHVEQGWKPWAVYINGRWPNDDIEWHRDLILPSKASIDEFNWEPADYPAVYFLETLTAPGAVICDPFCGVARTGQVAIWLDRRFIGVEGGEARFNQAVRALEKASAMNSD
jgi:DNA modification methylase